MLDLIYLAVALNSLKMPLFVALVLFLLFLVSLTILYYAQTKNKKIKKKKCEKLFFVFAGNIFL